MRELPENTLYDKRLVDRHIQEGLITREEVDKRIAALGDVADAGESIDVAAMTMEQQARRQSDS